MTRLRWGRWGGPRSAGLGPREESTRGEEAAPGRRRRGGKTEAETGCAAGRRGPGPAEPDEAARDAPPAAGRGTAGTGAGAVPPPGWRQSNFLLCLAAQQGALCSGSPASPRDGRTQKCSQDWTLRYILSCTLMHARARARTHSSPSLRLILTLCLLGPRSLPRPPRPHGQRPPRVITALSSSLVISAT